MASPITQCSNFVKDIAPRGRWRTIGWLMLALAPYSVMMLKLVNILTGAGLESRKDSQNNSSTRTQSVPTRGRWRFFFLLEWQKISGFSNSAACLAVLQIPHMSFRMGADFGWGSGLAMIILVQATHVDRVVDRHSSSHYHHHHHPLEPFGELSFAISPSSVVARGAVAKPVIRPPAGRAFSNIDLDCSRADLGSYTEAPSRALFYYYF